MNYRCAILNNSHSGLTKFAIAMRWKWLLIVSLVAALLGCAAWCSFVIVAIGRLGLVESREGYIASSLLILIAIPTAAAIIVYRRTSRRRKTQALLALLLTFVFTVAACFTVARFFPRPLLYATPGNWFAG